jgi:protein TonB
MAVARQEPLDALDALEGLFVTRGPRKRGALVGTGIAILIHVGVAVALVQADTIALFEREKIVEMVVQEPTPPPPDVKPEPPKPEPPPEPKPKIVMRRAPAPTPTAAPPPNEAPRAAEAPPSFGVTMDSVVAGDGPGMAVPVGNTLMTKPTKAPPPGPPPPPAGDPNALPPATPEIFVSEQAKVLKEVKAEFPPDLSRMGIEGVVIAKLYIDDNGDVKRVKIVESAGHGLDELAKNALKQFKFSPARTSDGKAVPVNITYKYTFELPQ